MYIHIDTYVRIYFSITAPDSETVEDIGIKKKRVGTGKSDPVLDYMQAKRHDEKELEARKLALEERRLDLEERRSEDKRLERERFWTNAEKERELHMERLKKDSEEKLMLFQLLRDFKK